MSNTINDSKLFAMNKDNVGVLVDENNTIWITNRPGNDIWLEESDLLFIAKALYGYYNA
jgi:hypothetical protein